MLSVFRWGGPVALLLALGACSLPQQVAWRPRVTGEPVAQSSRDLAALAKRHFEDGQLGLAVKEYSALAEREPHSVRALNGLAASYDRMGRFDLSGRAYRKALTRAPNDAQTLNNIGYSAYLQGRTFLALAFFNEALAVAGDTPEVRNNKQLAERLLVHDRTARCEAADKREAATEKGVRTNLPPRPEGIRLERIGLFTERLITRSTPPAKRPRDDSERTRRLLELLTPRGGGRPDRPDALRRGCGVQPARGGNREGNLRPVHAPGGISGRVDRTERRERSKDVPDFANLGELTDGGLLVDRRSQLLPWGS